MMPAGETMVLGDDDELLYRQVHPTFVRDGRPSSQAFRPTPKDAGKLSVSRASLTTPAGAYEHHTQALVLSSAGTWAISVGECRHEVLAVLSDARTSPPDAVANPAHALVDFTPHSNSQREARATRLARKATERGRLHPPVAGASAPETPPAGD